MNYHGAIGISAMIADIKSKPDETFTIEWWRAADSKKSGKKAGTVKRVAKAIYGAPKKMNSTRTISSSADYAAKAARNNADFRDTGQFPITDSETNEFLTPLFSHIKSYNGLKVKH